MDKMDLIILSVFWKSLAYTYKLIYNLKKYEIKRTYTRLA